MSDNSKSEKSWKIIVLAIISGASTGIVSGIVTNMVAYDSLHQQIEELKNQNGILTNESADQKIKTIIMNDTLNEFVESQKKKSLISVKILPHVGGFPVQIGTSYKESGPGQPERQIRAVPGFVTLNADTNATFDIVITNVGSDTAILNGFLVEYLPNGTATSHEIKTNGGDINKILTSNSYLVIPVTFHVTADLAPVGTLHFVVNYDNGISESGAIWYEYVNSTLKVSNGTKVKIMTNDDMNSTG